ncbi:MAG: hypothetical protein K6L81_01695 [Agarilytica sp.]
MPHDSLPARRNLTVLSLLIILFFFAEGSINGNGLSTPLLNISLENTTNAIIFVWLMFGYFWLRFYQATREEYSAALRNSVSELKNHWYTKKVIGNFANAGFMKKDGFMDPDINHKGTRLVLSWRAYRGGALNEHGNLTGFTQAKDKSAVSLRNKHLLYRIGFWLFSAIHHEEVGSYVLPHMLAVLAILLGGKHHALSVLC